MKSSTLMHRWAALIVVVLVPLALGCGGTQKVPPNQEMLVFSSDRALDGSDSINAKRTKNIWVMNADGSEVKPLTRLTAEFAHSDGGLVSPDGTKIVFYSTRALDGSDAPNPQPTCVTVMPCFPIFDYNIWVMNADGSGAMPLTLFPTESGLSGVAWSPDGTKIAFTSARSVDGSGGFMNVYNIWVMNADGTGARPLTKLTAVRADNISPTWSPDGTKIAFTSAGALDGRDAANRATPMNTISNIWVMNSDGTGARPLTTLTAGGTDLYSEGASSYTLTWSPDGTKIAYVSRRALDGSDATNTNATVNIWVMNSDGTGAKPLTSLTSFPWSGGINWSPDGSKIVFHSERALDGSDARNTNATMNIWVMNTDGSAVTPLTRLTASDASSAGPMWSRDGTTIVFGSTRTPDGSNAPNAPNFNVTSNIWEIRADGTDAKPLTRMTIGDGCYGAQWLP